MSYHQPKLDLVHRSASGTQLPTLDRANEVAKLIDISKCIGCKACQVACMEWNDLRQDVEENVGVYDNPHDLSPAVWTLMRFEEFENTEQDRLEWLIRKDGCMHCADPGCLKACPAPGAIVQYSNGIVDFISDNCIGCGYCVKGCPFNIPRISNADNKAYKCTLCSDRVAEGSGPACAKACPTKAITFGSKDDMIALAEERVADLRDRGYDNAGLYDPPGVNGTHVMYVLHHADRPSLYSGLPDEPRISPLVEAWKGVTKVAGLAAIGAVAVFGAIHYAVSGPNRVTEEDEESAARLETPRGGEKRR
jgi:formate dehydrogenase iron-sulfur subunit